MLDYLLGRMFIEIHLETLVDRRAYGKSACCNPGLQPKDIPIVELFNAASGIGGIRIA